MPNVLPLPPALRRLLLTTGLACTLPLAAAPALAQSPSAVERFTGEAGPATDPEAIGVAPDGANVYWSFCRRIGRLAGFTTST